MQHGLIRNRWGREFEVTTEAGSAGGLIGRFVGAPEHHWPSSTASGSSGFYGATQTLRSSLRAFVVGRE